MEHLFLQGYHLNHNLLKSVNYTRTPVAILANKSEMVEYSCLAEDLDLEERVKKLANGEETDFSSIK